MDVATRKALEGSIRKWRAIVKGTDTDLGPRNCPLCEKFRSPWCDDCPVAQKTGHGGCQGSPYDDWLLAADLAGTRRARTPALKRLAQAELDFLISLRPRTKPKRKAA